MSTSQKAQSPSGVGQSANETADIQIVNAPHEERKHEATLMAQFALRGHAVHRATDSGYLVCKHGYVKHCVDLQSLESFADQVGVPR